MSNYGIQATSSCLLSVRPAAANSLWTVAPPSPSGRRSVPYPTPDPLTANSRALMFWMGRTRPATEWRSTGSNLSIHETMGSRSASSLCQDVAGQPGSLSHLLQRLRLHLIRHLRISSGLCPLSVLTRALEGAKDVEYPQDTFRYPPF